MRLQHNQGLFTYNRYNHTNTELNKTLNKLSSGYKINQAADDAAGLGISENMRAQIRGLNQAGENIQDGISLINTAEGGLGQIQNPYLVRMRELIIQAANDTNTPEDRQKIQMELDQLKRGIDDIAEDTEFNGIPLLTPNSEIKGQLSTNQFDIVFLIDDSGTMREEIDSVALGLNTFVANMAEYGDVQVGTVSLSKPNRPQVNLPLTSDTNKINQHIKDQHQANGGLTYTYSALDNLLSGTGPVTFRQNSEKVVVILTDRPNETAASVTQNDLKTKLADVGVQSYLFGIDFRGRDSANTFQYDNDYTFVDKIYKPANASEISENLTPGLANVIVENSSIGEIMQSDITIHLGANELQNTKIPLFNNTAAALGMAEIIVDPYDAAMEALRRVDIANNIVSERRSLYGSFTNRLEHSYNNVKNTEENLMKAESTLRDADMAKEVSKLQKDQVILQSAQSMMAQINQMSQGILEILG